MIGEARQRICDRQPLGLLVEARIVYRRRRLGSHQLGQLPVVAYERRTVRPDYLQRTDRPRHRRQNDKNDPPSSDTEAGTVTHSEFRRRSSRIRRWRRWTSGRPGFAFPAEDEPRRAWRGFFDKASEGSASCLTSFASTHSGPGTSSSWDAFYDELMRGESGLTKAQREMIAVVVSTANRCHYCIVSHAAALRKLTGDPLLVEQLGRTTSTRSSSRGSARCSTSRSS